MIAGRPTVVAGVVTHRQDGRLVRATGPIGCTRDERIAITVAVRQRATAARARRWCEPVDVAAVLEGR